MKKAKEAAVQYRTTTTTITLSADLVERLRQAAEWKGIALEDAAQEAVLSYVGQYGFEKVTQEQVAFEKMKPELLKQYRGRYVAVHNGEVVESAADLRSLRSKVFAHFGFTPMLHKLVTDEPDRVIVARSPKVERR
jgi:hypothetical protein